MASTEGSKIQKLWSLLLEDFRSLTDEQIDELLAEKEVLREHLMRLWNAFPFFLQDMKNSRAKKKRMAQFSTEELKEMQRHIGDRRMEVLRSYGDNDDDLPDSFFEAPPIDSDEHVISELLREKEGGAK